MKKIYILRLEVLSISDDDEHVGGSTKTRAISEGELKKLGRPLKDVIQVEAANLCVKFENDEKFLRLLDAVVKTKPAQGGSGKAGEN